MQTIVLSLAPHWSRGSQRRRSQLPFVHVIAFTHVRHT